LAPSNSVGPLLLGPLFDTIGRRAMIAGTYAVGGILLIVTAVVFGLDAFTAWTQTFAWMLIFFFASAAASSAYLTASEVFPLETRALAIAIFYAVGTAIGGTVAPALFGHLIETGSPWALAGGYIFAASLTLLLPLRRPDSASTQKCARSNASLIRSRAHSVSGRTAKCART